MNGETVIEVKNVRKYFKKVKAVDGIDLQIRKGEYVALLGPNGAGKTTLVEMIEGLQQQDSGEITLFGKKWKGNADFLHRQIGISLQETRYFDKLTVFETLSTFAAFFRLSRERVYEIMDIINLTEKKKSYVVNLSGGQRQKLSLGIALINYPKILLLDEPTTGLDPVARREIWNILKKFREEKQATLILTTHYMEEAQHLCERIIILDQGKILAQGTVEKLLKENRLGEIIEFNSVSRAATAKFPGIKGFKKYTWDEKNQRGRLVVDNVMDYFPVFNEFTGKENLPVNSLQCYRQTLDDLFITLTGRRLTD